MECDVLVIGAGPAGLWAARKAAHAGLNAVVLEEHLAIGLQKHCSGWILGCEFTRSFFHELRDVIPHQTVSRMVIRDPLSGDIIEDIEDTGLGGYLVRRSFSTGNWQTLQSAPGRNCFCIRGRSRFSRKTAALWVCKHHHHPCL